MNDALSDLVLVDPKVFDVQGIYRDAPSYWKSIWSTLTSAASGAAGETGAGPRSIAKLSEDEASALAQKIYSLDAMLDDYNQDQRRKQ